MKKTYGIMEHYEITVDDHISRDVQMIVIWWLFMFVKTTSSKSASWKCSLVSSDWKILAL